MKAFAYLILALAPLAAPSLGPSGYARAAAASSADAAPAVAPTSAAPGASADSVAAPTSSLLPARVMKAANARVAAGEYPMLVIGVVDGDKSRLYGFNAEGDPVPKDATVFEIGSITKTFTGLALAEAVEAGKLTLDEPVSKLLPKFKIPSYAGQSITLGTLADQHSGLPRLPSNLKPSDPADPYAGYDSTKLASFLLNYTLPRAPGSAYEYSNLGYGLLGYALARHAHTNYAELVKRNILVPLGMSDCGVHMTKAMRAHLAAGHDVDGKAAESWDFGALAGAGAIRCSAADMLLYLKANMGAYETPLYPAMQLSHKARAGAGDDERVGLGWLTRGRGDRAVVWHNGMTGGYASFIGFTAEGKRGVVVLANIQRSVSDLGFATLLAHAELAPVQTKISMSPAALDAYVGYYQFTPRFVLAVFRSGDQLYAQATGQGALPIYPSAKDEFFATVTDISISFLPGKHGKIFGLVLHQHGNTPAKRVSGAAAAKTIGKTIKPLGAATLRDYVGRYKFESGDTMEVTRKGDQLYARLGDQNALPIYPSARDHFFYIVVKANLVFQRDANGKVDAVVLHQNGTTQNAKRLPSR